MVNYWQYKKTNRWVDRRFNEFDVGINNSRTLANGCFGLVGYFGKESKK